MKPRLNRIKGVFKPVKSVRTPKRHLSVMKDSKVFGTLEYTVNLGNNPSFPILLVQTAAFRRS